MKGSTIFKTAKARLRPSKQENKIGLFLLLSWREAKRGYGKI